MASKNNQVGIEINTQVKGDAELEALTHKLDDAAKVLGGELATKAQTAAAELRELAAQGAAIKTFETLKQQAADGARALKSLEGEVAAYGKQIGTTPTLKEAANLERLQASADRVRTKLDGQKQALAGATADLQRLGIASTNTQAAQQRLAAQTQAVVASVQGLVPATQNAAAGAANLANKANAGADGVKALGSSSQALTGTLDQLKGALAAVGLSIGLKEVAQAADAYNNLQARIKLTTGEGELFTQAWTEVSAIAKRTSSDLTETGNLFTKIAEAGKSAGLSTRAAVEQAAGLTETINQSIQLSGASAEASKAAITQLIQGLQSGVLRGDEFNSIMEQAPRLSKALADSLGITTGELRKMAEQGALTTDILINALKTQSGTIAAEFDKLPPTIGRALTNLSNAWTQYVGESDKASGASLTAAKALNALSENISTVAKVVMDLGKVSLAYKLLDIAGALGNKARAAALAAAATEKETLATGANTVATKANTAAKLENVAASAKVGVGAQTVGSALASTGNRVVAFASRLGQIGLVVTTAVLAFDVLKDAVKGTGTWLGEGVAKLMGYKDGTKAIEEANRQAAESAKASTAAVQAQAAALETAKNKQFDLSKETVGLIGKFDGLVKSGNSAAEAIGKIGKEFDLSNTKGIKDAASVLDKLVADGKLTASQFQAAWATALDGQDLAKFEVMAKAAFAGIVAKADDMSEQLRKAIAGGVTGKELDVLMRQTAAAIAAADGAAVRLANVLDQTLREAIKRSGQDFQILSGGMSAASISAINDTEAIIKGLDRLKAQGVNTQQALIASIGKGIQTADSEKAVEALKSQIESVRKVLGDKITDGFLDEAIKKSNELSDTINKATPGINSLREAFAELGLKSREDLASTASRAQQAFEVITKAGQQEGESYMAWQARKQQAAQAMLARMIEANGGLATEAIKTRAAMEGLEVQVDATGKATVRAMDAGAEATKSLSNEAAGAARAMDGVAAAAKRAADEQARFMQAVDNTALGAVRDKLASGTLSLDDQKMVEAQYAAAKSNLQLMQQNGLAYSLEGQADAVRVFNEANRAMDAINALKRSAAAEKNAATSSAQAQPFGAQSSAATTTVNINLNGRTSRVNVASAADASALEALLRQLALDGARAA